MPLPSAILVTGGAGYIGSHTIRHLASLSPEPIVVLDSLVYGHRDALVSPNTELVVGNMADPVVIAGIFARYQITAVLHFAAYAMVGESMAEPLKYYANNLAAPLVLLEAMRQHGTRHFIFSSTCATFGNPEYVPMDEEHPQKPINPYGQSKLMLEQVLRDCDQAFGIRHVILRYFNASGCSADGVIGEDHTPESHLIPRTLMAITGEAPHVTVFGTDYPTPDGTCIRDYIHVMDLASAHVLALHALEGGTGREAFNVGNGSGFSVRQVIEVAREVTGHAIPAEVRPRRPGDPARLIAGSEKIRRELGWEPRYPELRQIVGTAWEWFRKCPDGYRQ